MIPHTNLFTGALGKLQNIGGSRLYTTPHTVSVPAEYSISVTYNIQGDLLAHSLDGRLWLYRRSRRLGIIALKWNSTKGELEYAAAQNISNNDDVILACGLDWILTNNNIFMVADVAPYILSARLFDANIPDTFLYSILRTANIGSSGIDPFTGQAWGKREDNGNSEGTGYFSKATHLLYSAGTHSFEQCYSLLPAVGDWQIFENFLVRRPDAETIGSYNYMQSVRPLIPLEFSNGTISYGTGYNFDHRGIQLLHRNGEIFGRGLHNIGKVSLLPAVFGEDGAVQEYYLYISPDFQRNTDYMQYDDWQNVALAALGNSSIYGVMSKQADTLAPDACAKATDGRIFLSETGEWLTLSENNGQIFFDALSYKGLLLDDNGAQLLLGETISDTQNIECRTLPQWLAPAGKVGAVTDEYVVASADNSVFYTSLVTGFNRQFISPNTIPLTPRTFQDARSNRYRLAISEGTNQNSRKVFGVNHLISQDVTTNAIQWQSVYKEGVKVQFLHSFYVYPFYDYFHYPYEEVKMDNEYCNAGRSVTPVFVVNHITTYATVKEELLYDNDEVIINIYLDGGTFDSTEPTPQNTLCIPIKEYTKLIFIHPDTGLPSDPIELTISLSHGSSSWTASNGQRYSGLSNFEGADSAGIREGRLGYFVRKTNLTDYSHTDSFKSIMDVPEEVKDWYNYSRTYYSITGQFSPEFPINPIKFQGFYDNYAVFTERFSGVPFLLLLQQEHFSKDWIPTPSSDIEIYEYPYVLDKHENNGATPTSKKTLHVIRLHSYITSGDAVFGDSKDIVLIFRTETDPDAFDFYTEFERSKSL